MGIRFQTSSTIFRNLTLHNLPSRSLSYRTKTRITVSATDNQIKGTLVVELSKISRVFLRKGTQVENKSEIFHSLSLDSDTLFYKNKIPAKNECLAVTSVCC